MNAIQVVFCFKLYTPVSFPAFQGLLGVPRAVEDEGVLHAGLSWAATGGEGAMQGQRGSSWKKKFGVSSDREIQATSPSGAQK